MSTVKTYAIQAELSQAAYGMFLGKAIATTELTNSDTADMSLSQATQFTETWQVTAQYTDPITGVSATVFEAKNGSAKYLAIRGTEPTGNDLTADGLLASAIPPTLNPQFIALKIQLDTWLNDPAVLQGQNFTVTGHSLGGYLAAAVKQSYSQVTEAYLYNAPGVSGLLGNLMDALSSALGLSSVSTDNIWNIRGSEGFPVIAGLGYQLGSPISVQTENTSNNHSIALLTDALAVYSAYSQLSPNASTDQLGKLIDAFGSTKDIAGSNEKTMESALDALRTILLNPDGGKIMLSAATKTTAGDRDKFYANLYELQNSSEFKSFAQAGNAQLTMLTDLSAGTILSKIEGDGQQGLAARFALVALNPFILEGASIDYGAFNANNALNRFDPATGSGALTTKYLVDRMTMLMRKNWFNVEDKNPLDATVTFSKSNHPFQNSNDYFEDVASGYKISQSTLTDQTPRYFFGADGADNPAASNVEDHLYGGGGNDTLNGRGGDDYLEGGSGTDTYVINASDGIDTLWDADGQGVIRLGTVEVKGKTGIEDKDWAKLGNSWVDRKNGIEYVLEDKGNGVNDLLIMSGNGSGARIKSWSDGKLGITLAGNTAPEDLEFAHTFVGDLAPSDPSGSDEFGNLLTGPGAAPDREDTLRGSSGNDWIQGAGGNDTLYGKEGDDRLEGGTGQDVLSGSWGKDVILGGADSDVILGHDDEDRLYADTEYTLDEAYTLSIAQVGSGQRGDLLDGAYANDIMIGAAGDDVSLGGMGKDVIMGLGGDDTIEGDFDADLVNREWSVTRSTTSENGVKVYVRSYNFNLADTGVSDSNSAGDDDVIYGGAGKDWIFTQGGDDFVDAGADDDVVFGSAGNDLIFGQGGNDVLSGDSVDLDASLHGDDYLNGGDGNDKLTGYGGADHLEGGVGDDKLYADAGSDMLDGGVGDDQLFGGPGSDTLIGGEEADNLNGDAGNDTLDGGLGVDRLFGGAGDDTYLGVENGDFIADVEGRSRIVLADKRALTGNSANEPEGFTLTAADEPDGGPSNMPTGATWSNDTGVLQISLENGDTVHLSAALYGMGTQIDFNQGMQSIDLETWVAERLHDDVTGLSLNIDWVAAGLEQPVTYVYSGAGNDVLSGGGYNDTIKGYNGDDQLAGEGGDDSILGGLGNDSLLGDAGIDTLQGEAGNDQLQGGTDNDVLNGGEGNDNLFGEAGADLLYGDAGADELQGGADDDTLFGGADDDTLFGQEGNDVLNGGTGNDQLLGNAGDDVYRFDLGGGRDGIWEDDAAGDDVLLLGAGILPADIEVGNFNGNLVLAHRNGVDQVTVNNWYFDSSWQLQQFEFADGTVWSAAEVGARAVANMRGTPDSDTLYGSESNETFVGLDGDDTLYGNEGDDTMAGGHGDDQLYGGLGANSYRFSLGDGNDTVNLSEDNTDTIYFSADINSGDIIVERIGNDLWLRHQNGSDSIKITDSYVDWVLLKEVVFEADGTRWSGSALQSMGMTHGNSYTLNPGDGARIIDDWGGDDSLTFGAGIAEADIVITRVGQDLKFSHTNGADSVTVKGWFDNFANQIETVQFAATGRVLTATQHTAPLLTLTGTAGNDVIQGGNAYDETLTGLAGDDSLNGGGGQDTYLFNSGDGQDTITDTSPGGNFLVCGAGLSNLLSISTNADNDTVYSFGSDKVTVTAGSSAMTLKFVADGTAAAETLDGSGYSDVIHGQDGNDMISGYAAADDLYGDTGNDTLIGGNGSDWLYGGDGDDVLDGNRLTGSADAEIYGSDAADHYVGGHGNDTLNGNISNDHYYFNLGDGHDTIIEGSYSSGAWYYSAYDELHFGPGINWESLQANKLNNDLVITVSPADTVTIKDWFLNNRTQVDVFRFADGSVRTATDFTRLTNSFHGTEGNDVVTGSASVDSILYGHGGDDTLNAGSANDMLYGGSGNDSLAGNSGNDALYGEAGDDMLDGGFGNDNYYFSRNGGQDVISDSSGSDFVHFDATVTASEFALSRTANDLVLTNTVTGDRITLRDYMNGDIDPYIYVGSNVVNYNNAAAIESIFFADGSALPSGSEIQDELLNMRGTGSDDTLSGTAWADVLYGYDGNDTLYGFDDDDVLYGGNGNDYLDGGIGRTNLLYGQGGDDVLVGNANGSDSFGHSYLHGGFGNDTYLYKPGASFNAYDDGGDDKIVFDSAIRLTDIRFRRWNDELNISSSGGPDDIIIPNHFISDSYKIEHIQLADGTLIGLRDVQEGTGAKDVLNGTAEDSILLGDYDTDTLNGNDGNDWLDGGLSGDAMLGGRGDDIYIVDSAKDSVTELANQGTDTVLSAVGYTLDANVERLVLMGTGKMNGTGNALDNVITGNSAANTLSGNAGNDWLDGQGGIDKLIGGAGDDTLVVDNAGETLTERSNEGTDTVRSSVTFTLPNHIENLTLIGTLAISATGNALNNTLIGNGAGNTLSGDAGNDILDGAVGNDTLIGGKGGDIYRFGRDGGVDTISENDATANTIDIVQCLPSIDADQLWFQHVGNNLEVSVIGTADKLILQNWYLGAAYHLEQFKTAGGLTLQHDSVESLVQAMAPLAVPEIGQFELPPEYAANLDPLITSLWL